MAILKDLIVHGSSRFLNKIYASEIQTPLIEAETGIFKKLKADDATVVGLLDVKGQLHTNNWSNSNIATIDGSFYITPTIGSDSGTVTITATSLNFSGTDYAVTSLYLGDGSAITWPQYSKVLVTGQILSNGEWIPLGTLLGQLSAQAAAASININNIKDNKNQISNVLATLVNEGTTSSSYRNLKVSLYQRASSSTAFYPLGIYMTATGTNGRTFLDIYGGVEALSNSNNYGGFAEPNVRIGNLQGLPNVGGQTPSGWGIYTDNGYFKGIIAADKGYIGAGSKYWIIANEDDIVSRSYIYNGTNSITSIEEGIYLGTDGIRNYKDSTHFVTIRNGVISALGVDLSGKITASSGSIAGWRIESTYLASGNSTKPAANVLLLSPNGTTSSYTVAGQAKSGWMITTGTSFGVNKDGGVYATLGKIGGWNIDSNSFAIGSWGTDNSAMLCTGTGGSKSIGGSGSINNWVFTAGANFGVTKSGALYASSANISGKITATSGEIGGITIDNNGKLWITDANISGTISGDHIDASSISIGSLNGASNYAQKTDVTQAIDNIEVGGRNLVWNSNFHSPINETWSNWGSPTTREIVTINGENWMHIVTTANSYQGYSQNQANRNGFGEIQAGEQIIFSFDAYSKVDGQEGCIGIHWRNSNNITVNQNWASFNLTTTKKRYVTNAFTVPDNAVGFNIMVGQRIATVQELWITNIKGEKGNKATDWTPAPEDTQESISNVSTVANTALGQSVWYAECSTAEGTAVKVATISPVTTNFVLTKGATVNIKFTNTNSATNSSLQLNVNGTGAKNIKYIYNGSLTNIPKEYLKTNQMYQFRYDGTYWVVQMMYNSNHVDRSRYAVSLYASEAISSAKIAVLGLNNKLHILSSSSFYTSCPLLYIETSYSADDVTKPTSRTTNYTYWGASFNLTSTHSIQSAAANTNVYVVGTLSGDIFTPNTTVLTCAEPTTENGLYYMLLGRMTSTTNAVLQAEHPIYVFKNGNFQKLEATTATNYITQIDNTGIKITPYDKSGNDYLQINSDAISMYRNNIETLKIEDSSIRIGKNKGPHFSLTNDKLIGYGDIGNVYFEVGKSDNTTIQLFYGNGERTSFEIGPLFKTVYYVKKNDVDLISGTDYEIHVTAVRYNIYFKTEPILNSTISVTYKDFYKSFIYTISSSSSGDITVTSQQGPQGTATVITIQTHKSYEAESIYYKKSGTDYWQQWTLEAEEESGTYKYSFHLGEGVNVNDQVKLSYSTEEHTDLIPDTVTKNYTWDATYQNSTLLTIPSASQILSVSINNTVLTENEDYTLDGLLKYGYLILYNAPAVNEKIEIKLLPEEYNFEYQPTYFNFSNTNLENSIKGIGAASFGSKNVNKGIFCFAEGVNNIVTGYASHAEGYNNIAAGSHSHVGGSNSLVLGQNTFAYGDNLQATYLNSAAFGFYNSPENQLFSIGKGGYENAFSINKDGKIQIGGQLLAGTTYSNRRPLFTFDTLIWTGQSIPKNGSWKQTAYQLTRKSGYKALAIAGIGIYDGTGGVYADWCVPMRCYVWSADPYDLLDVYIWNQNTTAATRNTNIFVKILYIADSAFR